VGTLVERSTRYLLPPEKVGVGARDLSPDR
jgi:hypothetical protein